MAEAGWGHGRPVETDTAIAAVLHAFITQGGQILGARRWPDNPLTLTHVRWQGPGSGPIEAVRRPPSEDTLPAGEREVWVQLALAFPPVYSGVAGAEVPWSPLTVDRERAFEWLQVLRQEQRPRHSSGHPSVQPSGWQTYNAASSPRMRTVDADGPFGRPSMPAGPTSFMRDAPTVIEPAVSPTAQTAPMSPRQTVPPFGEAPRSSSSYGYEEPTQRTGSWQRGGMDAPEVVVVPCVEVELPPMLGGPAADDYRRDFARDVAMHFSRAARAVPQVREVRGWMRGERLVLAARFVVAVGHRPPTQAEMNGVAQILADALTQRTLPYVQLAFSDPGEWSQGAPLPE